MKNKLIQNLIEGMWVGLEWERERVRRREDSLPTFQEIFWEFFYFFQELRSQGARIFGSIDLLGNPLGLVFDVTEGISGLISNGNVEGLIKNVAHGVSNSTAKVCRTL